MPIKHLLNSNKILFISTVLFALTACTGSKDVVTYDSSVEYRNAITLPPLKKPSRQQPEETAKQIDSIEESIDIVTNNGQVEEPQEFIEDQFENETPVVVDLEPSLEIEESENIIEEVELEEERIGSEVTDSSKVTEQASPINTKKHIINSRVIESNDNGVRLQIEEGFAGAWGFLSENLKRSNITVYNKNQSALRFAIGCGDMEEEPLVTKRGGWSFFNKKPQKTEHCSLQLASSKANTTVAVLSRSGDEVAASAAKELFSRLLNN